MPKATDANAAGWGGSDLTVTELGTLGLAQGFDTNGARVGFLVNCKNVRFAAASLAGNLVIGQIKEQFNEKLQEN